MHIRTGVMKSLSDMLTPEEAIKSMQSLGFSTMMADSIAEAVSYFHSRGEEFREYWNKKYSSLRIEREKRVR